MQQREGLRAVTLLRFFFFPLSFPILKVDLRLDNKDRSFSLLYVCHFYAIGRCLHYANTTSVFAFKRSNPLSSRTSDFLSPPLSCCASSFFFFLRHLLTSFFFFTFSLLLLPQTTHKKTKLQSRREVGTHQLCIVHVSFFFLVFVLFSSFFFDVLRLVFFFFYSLFLFFIVTFVFFSFSFCSYRVGVLSFFFCVVVFHCFGLSYLLFFFFYFFFLKMGFVDNGASKGRRPIQEDPRRVKDGS